jgi:putative ABC transport system permease protein
MDTLLQDIRYSVRTLLKSPGFAAVAVIALALGIGANSAIFSAVNAVLLRPLPYKDASRLVMIWQDHRARGGPEREWASPSNFYDWRDHNQVFDHVAALVGWGPTLTGQGEPEDLVGAAVSDDTFSMLGVQPSLGRTFRPDEDQPGAEKVVVLSDKLWRRRFGADESLIGKPIILGGDSYTVVGVMPAKFKFPIIGDAELWRTLRPALGKGCGRGCVVLRVIAQLKPGVTIEDARLDMNALASNLAQQYPEADSGIGITLVGLQEQIVGDTKPVLLVLLGAVAFVLLIACANVANLLLARASSREKEIAIRTALGARRLRLIRQLLTESLLLALIGSSVGLLLAVWMVDLLVAFSPPGAPRVDEIKIDGSVLLFTFGVAVLTGLLFGLIPAVRSSKPDLNQSLKEGKGSGTSASRRSVRSALVVAEVALALMLLIGAGLLMKSFVNLIRVDPGFNAGNVIVASVGLPRTRYPEPNRIITFYDTLLERIKSLPGVQAAGAVSSLPLGGGGTDQDFRIEGLPEPKPGEEPVAWYSSVTPDYFQTLGVKLIKGRLFTEDDRAGAPPVVVISESMSKRYFSGEEPLGKRIGTGGGDKIVWHEIVGVTADVKHFGLGVEARPSMYLPLAQAPARGMAVAVRTTSDATSIAAVLRSEVAAIDKDLAVSSVRSMQDIVGESVAEPRLTVWLLGIFAAVAMLLSAIGIYGVMSYSVTQRTREIGLRMALGAQASDVLRLVVRQALLLAFVGVAIGLIGAFALTRFMSTLLFEVSASDPATYFVISIILTGVALVASALPARRAIGVDPMVALRYE